MVCPFTDGGFRGGYAGGGGPPDYHQGGGGGGGWDDRGRGGTVARGVRVSVIYWEVDRAEKCEERALVRCFL